jgi:hypothetical protein
MALQAYGVGICLYGVPWLLLVSRGGLVLVCRLIRVHARVRRLCQAYTLIACLDLLLTSLGGQRTCPTCIACAARLGWQVAP